MRTSPGLRKNAPLMMTVGSLPPATGAPNPPAPREDVSVVDILLLHVSHRRHKACAPSHLPEEDGHHSTTVGSSTPEPGIISGPRLLEDGHYIAADPFRQEHQEYKHFWSPRKRH